MVTMRIYSSRPGSPGAQPCRGEIPAGCGWRRCISGSRQEIQDQGPVRQTASAQPTFHRLVQARDAPCGGGGAVSSSMKSFPGRFRQTSTVHAIFPGRANRSQDLVVRQVFMPSNRYMGQRPIRAVASGKMPIQPHGVLGPTKTRLMSIRPTTIRIALSVDPIFLCTAVISFVSTQHYHKPDTSSCVMRWRRISRTRA